MRAQAITGTPEQQAAATDTQTSRPKTGREDPGAPSSKSRLGLGRHTRRPWVGALAGAVLIYALFCIAGGHAFYSVSGTANWLIPAAELGILAVPVSLLMIAGEFDLSIGAMLATSGMIVAVGVEKYGLSIGVAVLLAFGVALAIGFINGLLVVKTGVPSFIVTLAAMFVLLGVTVGETQILTGSTIVSYSGYQSSVWSKVLTTAKIGSFSVEIVWWLALTAVGALILTQTRFGNWIFATGGNRTAARNMGVRVELVRILLFMATSAGAAMVGLMQALSFGSGDVTRGADSEFQAIIAAVIGGCLLNGGYGSVIGAGLGALTFGMAQIGIPYAGWNTNWFDAFLGGMLLLAVLTNTWVRRRALELG
jgi:simple sugar transport system permease protein